MRGFILPSKSILISFIVTGAETEIAEEVIVNCEEQVSPTLPSACSKVKVAERNELISASCRTATGLLLIDSKPSNDFDRS